ncbi:nucleoside/nucleotide kinase family protein [Actinokineospora pegani]|uniref:uridine kinase n=1 Tax=Actinokineospora pegani TaxID=2654637 RepID=UPI0012EA595E|nr:uridine kinase [Actinokineospora pegani]
MRFRPVRPEALVTELVERVAARDRAGWTRVLVDGAGPARPDALADAAVDPLRVLGREVLRVRAGDFLRPASLRFEHGKRDPDARRDRWLDAAALRREVLDPLGPGGSGRALPALWDAATDRATRAGYVGLPAGGVVLVDGEFLLGRGLPHELSAHLWLSPGALARGLPADEHWALPAFADYDREVDPLRAADLGVRGDDPRHPAVLEPAGRPG